MTGRVILFGATGYTGRLAAEAMTRAGLAPVLAGRSADALIELTGDLAGLGPVDAPPSWQVADADDPASVRSLVTRADDVLVSTVGPFSLLGRPAVDAAVEQGCSYLDCSGEGPFVRAVFDSDGPRASAAGARLLPAFGYDFVPGNLAGWLAIQEARSRGRVPVVVDVGYFTRGPVGLSSGTRASATFVAAEPVPALRNGQVVTARQAVTTFEIDGRRQDALAVGGSEPFTLPRLDRGVRDVGVYLGRTGRWTRATHVAGTALVAGGRLPGFGAAIRSGLARVRGSATGIGPSPMERRGTATVVVARTLDGVGRQLSSVRVEGPNPYDLTAELLAWGAAMLATGQASGPGTLGPVDAFGPDALEQGCADLGLHRVG